MPPEVESVVETEDIVDPDAGANDAAVHAEFVSGFGEVEDGAPTDTPELSQPPEPTAETPSIPAEPSPAAQPVSTPSVVQLTQEKLTALEKAASDVGEMRTQLEKMSGQVFGKFGGLERTIKQLQEQTPSGQAIAITDEDLQELSAEFPEVAKLTRSGLNRIFGKFKGTGLDEQKFTDLVTQRVDAGMAQVESRVLLNTLADLRDDWQDVVGLDAENWALAHPDQPYQPSAYRQWLATQTPDYQQAITNSMRPGQIVKSIELFEKAQKEQRKPAPKPTPIDTRRRRFEAAVTPRSSSGPSIESEPSEAEAFRQGFKETAHV